MDLLPEHLVTDADALATLYGQPGEASLLKEVPVIHPAYRTLIEASPFAVLATAGPGGLDASPRGDPAGFVTVEDERTLLLPDRRGNNRIDSLRNILADPRLALLFLVPAMNETLRINGRGLISTDPALCQRFAMGDKLPRSVLVVQVETVFFQCSRALLRAQLWQPSSWRERSALPSTGALLQAVSQSRIDGAEYDRGLAPRVNSTLY